MRRDEREQSAGARLPSAVCQGRRAAWTSRRPACRPPLVRAPESRLRDSPCPQNELDGGSVMNTGKPHSCSVSVCKLSN